MAGRDSFSIALGVRTLVDMFGDQFIKVVRGNRAAHQFFREVGNVINRSPVGGKFLRNSLREIADRWGRKHALIGSAVSPFFEDILREVGKPEHTEGENVMPQKKEEVRPAKAVEVSVLFDKAFQNIACLKDPAHRDILHRELNLIDSVWIARDAAAIIARWEIDQIQHVAESLIASQGTPNDRIGLIQLLGMHLASTGGRLLQTDGEKTLRLMALLDIELIDVLIAATAGVAFETDEADELRFYAKLALLYGDGGEDDITHATKILRRLALKSPEEIRNWFNIKADYGRELMGSLVRFLTPQKPRPVADADIAAVRMRTAARKEKRRRRWNQQSDETLIIVTSKFTKI